MENKINVAELLKDCPKGMELDCTMFDGVYFDHVDESRHNSIKCYVNNGNEHFEIALDEHGQYISNHSAKCVIFPKGKTTWEGFQIPFKDGDIIFTHANCLKVGLGNTWISIFQEKRNGGVATYVDYAEDGDGFYSYNEDKGLLCMEEDIMRQRLASEEEKAKLFKAIKDNGYKWNSETNTLEKLPKFKVGDTISNGKASITINYIDNEYYCEIGRDFATKLPIKNQDEWDLISEKFPNKFNINTLIPFESRVLVRNDESQYWIPAFWGYKRSKYATTFGWCNYCIPYDGNEHLLETNKDCDEYFKTWK